MIKTKFKNKKMDLIANKMKSRIYYKKKQHKKVDFIDTT